MKERGKFKGFLLKLFLKTFWIIAMFPLFFLTLCIGIVHTIIMYATGDKFDIEKRYLKGYFKFTHQFMDWGLRLSVIG